MIPNTVKKAQAKIADIEKDYSIKALRENHNQYFNIERRIKKGETGLSNDFSKPLCLLYRTYLKAFDKVKKYNEKNNIIHKEDENDPSPTSVIPAISNNNNTSTAIDLSSISRRLFVSNTCESHYFVCLESHILFLLLLLFFYQCLASHILHIFYF